MPGCALIIDDAGNYKIEQVLEPKERRACSFDGSILAAVMMKRFIGNELPWSSPEQTGFRSDKL
jgi:hypothetical protein